MSTIELVGHVDEQHQLRVEVPVHVPPGPVSVVLELADEPANAEDGSWSRAVIRLWARDWSDPREDIYTLEDGEPCRAKND
jgi:hypothetical protein